MREKNSKNRLYKILDELYGVAQALQSFCFVLEQLQESFPATGAAEIKAVVDCCKIYVVAVEGKISGELDEMDNVLTELG